MKQPPPLPGGELEQAVLLAVWELKSASAPELYERVGAPSDLAYTTIGKVLERLHAKGLVRRERKGKSYVYRAAVARAVVEKAQATSLLDQFLGEDPKPAMATLVDAVVAVDPKLLDELAKVVAERRRARRGP